MRNNVVSDKPNAFNKIFTLFLCKIYDEKINEGTNNELAFQWLEGIDDDISFQLRLTDLYKKGMYEFLEKKVTDFSEQEFESKYSQLDSSVKEALRDDFKKLRLEKNNEFAIKEVYDEKSFKENAKVVKQIVELLQNYQIRYAEKQQYLSDFFELLLTTGLKQEAGQFFTPVPIAQFILKSLPLDNLIKGKLTAGIKDEILPYVIDYAAGSGHFLTESMNEVQKILDRLDSFDFTGESKKFIDISKIAKFDWALRYIYGIEKDYRLVKVDKVGCYLHGDGLANVIHSDGLASFSHKEYKNKLAYSNGTFRQDNKQFDIVVSNPPYSIPAFKQTTRDYYTEKDFELYNSLTDNSSEIECLFVERTKQLLKDGGIAGIILPSSILTNTGIYTKTRELLLKYFELVAITELSSNTFMATGTNTVVLFLKRRNNYDCINLKKGVDKFFTNLVDVTINGIENPVSKYINYVWEGVTLDDYLTLLRENPNEKLEENPNEKIKNHDLYKEYSQKLTSEDECTKLFDKDVFDNPKKASTYIYKAFNGDITCDIDETMKDNVSRVDLLDMMTFDRADFEKVINVKSKKK